MQALTEALRRIVAGDWNLGNMRPGLTVMQYAAEALDRAALATPSPAPQVLTDETIDGIIDEAVLLSGGRPITGVQRAAIRRASRPISAPAVQPAESKP